MKGLIGKKVGMTQVFTDEGAAVPVTVIDFSSCEVVGKRTQDKDAYSAVILGIGEAKEKHLTKAMAGSFKKAGAKPKRVIREFRVDAAELDGYTVGEPVKLDLFKKGDVVDVSGVTKGRGFSGVIRRWGFKGSLTKTHGTHEYQRHPGSIGQRKTPGRVYPNKKLPGQYGNENITVQNISVVEVIAEKSLILVKGGIPGSINGLVEMKPSVKSSLRAKHKAAKK
jgi:large subunit ribosomal protein L3